MKILTEDIIHFFEKQGYVIVSTVDSNGCPHNACKGIVHMEPDGVVHLLDLYKGRTFANLSQNPHMSITAVDEHKFKGYCLQGIGKIVPESQIKSHLIKKWEEKIASRLTKRLLKELKDEKGHPDYPEAILPKPEYLIIMDVEEIVDLSPRPYKR